VTVLDVSASMEDDFQDAKSFARSNLGKENTIIIVGETAEVRLEEASLSQAKSYISDQERKDVETDIVSGLETAQAYEGRVTVASDLEQTSGSGSAAQAFKDISSRRPVSLYESGSDNRWGIVEVEPGDEARVEIKNFMERSASLEVETPEGSRKVGIDAGAVETVSFETENGRNTVSLPEDGVKSDNTAYISMPEEETVELTYIADTENRYFKEAAELMDFIDYSFATPPVDRDLDADVYVMGESDRILESTAAEIEEKVRNGDSAVYFAQQGLGSKGFEAVPARLGQPREANVEITRPRVISVGKTQVFSASRINGSSWSSPREAILRSNHGKGEIMLYNVDDTDFRQRFFYPIFWKEVFRTLDDQRTIDELNRQTGAEVDGTELDTAGFHNVSRHLYAANLQSSAESGSEAVEAENPSSTDLKGKKQVQNLAAIFLALIAVLELLYLMRLGEA